ncbi:MAG: carboxypeptidase regulatory-like domain-containing protein [Terriglobia bacterium]
MPRNSECPCAVPVLTLAILLEIALSLCAAIPPTQTLKGEVLGDKNAPIAGAVCTLAGPGLPEEGRTETTGEKGGFEFTGLTQGSYDLTCAALGYEPLIQKDIGIAEGESPFIQVVLPREITVRQKVEVKEKAPAVSLETTAPPATISSGELRTLPLVEQKFLAALPLVPGVIRTPDGKINIKGVTENQGMLLIDSAETVDPVTGSFSIQVPIDAVESVEVQKTAYQAQYGRFSGGLTSVQTKAPQDRWNWELNDFLPSMRFRSGQMVGVEDDSPRLSFTGPVLSDKLSFSESFMYDLNKQPVRGLAWPHNEMKKQGFDSFTDLYYVSSPQNLVTANLKLFPMRQQYANIDSFIQQSASSDYAQSGFSVGATDRYMFSNGGVLTTLFQYTDFDSYAHGQGSQDMVLTPDNWEGNFFNAWTRASAQQELLQNYQSGKKDWAGRHTLRAGGEFIHRSYNDLSKSHPVQLLRPDGSLAELITFQGTGVLKAEDTELAAFAQDHWAFSDHIALDYGVRFSGQTLGAHAAFAPRFGLVYSPGRNAKTIIRSGIGLFYDRLPLLAGDFTQNLTRVVTNYDTLGNPLGPPIVLRNFYEKKDEHGIVVPSNNRLDSTPFNLTWNVEMDQEIRPNVMARVNYLSSRSYEEFIVNPLYNAPGGPVMLLSNTGASRYHELETTLRVKARENADFNISYVYSLARGDLNTLSAVFVPFEQPVIRPNVFGALPSNVPNRLVTWGRFKVPWEITASPVLDLHTGFPYSAVDVLQNYVGTPNSLRFPSYFSLDLQLSKDFRMRWIPWAKNHKFRGALRIFNITNHGNFRDVHNNVTSAYFGQYAGLLHRFYDVSLDVVY